MPRSLKAALALPRPRLPDIKAWVGRANTFAKALKKLDGDIDHVKFSVGAPMSRETVDRAVRGMHHSLPKPLRTFFERGCGRFTLDYAWTPGEGHADALARIGVEGEFISGGGTIGPPSRLREFEKECRDFVEYIWEGQEMDERGSEFLRSVPFLRIENGDFLALDPKHDADDPMVIYLAHDDDNQIIARNLASFLRTWEQLAYVGPESWVIEKFLDSKTGCMTSESRKAQTLRDIFRS